jgi:hypothetical protein
VFYVSQDGHVRELYYDGAWHGNDLTANTNGPLAGGSQLTSFFDGAIEHVFYISSGDNHVRELYNYGGWQGNDLTANTNGPAARAIAGLTSFFDGVIEHVFYISSGESHVRELYNYGGWQGNDLTADTNGPLAASNGLTSFFDGHIEHVFYRRLTDSHVGELYFNGTWQGNDLTAATNGPQTDCSSLAYCLASFFDGFNEHVFYLSPNGGGHVRELYDNGTWQGNDLTAATSGPAAYESALTGFFDGSIEHVFYISLLDGHVRQLYNVGSGAWYSNDLTAATNGPTTNSSPLTSFFDGHIWHVFYISYSDVRELYYDGSWHGNDLTTSTNGPGASRNALTSFITP